MDEATKPTANFATLRNCLWVRVMREARAAGIAHADAEALANRAATTFGRHSSDADDLFVLKHRIQAGVMKLIDEQVKTAADCVASKPLRARR
jgi:hypothetical protein